MDAYTTLQDTTMSTATACGGVIRHRQVNKIDSGTSAPVNNPHNTHDTECSQIMEGNARVVTPLETVSSSNAPNCSQVLKGSTVSGQSIQVHCVRHASGAVCREFIVTSPPFRYKQWLICTLLFNIIGFSLQLHLQDLQMMTMLAVILTAVLVLKLYFKVQQESMLVVASVGVQLTTTFALGHKKAKFVDMADVRGIVINEAVTMHRVIFYLALLLGNATQPGGSHHGDTMTTKKSSLNDVTGLVPLFTCSWPSLESLRHIHSQLQDILHRR